MKIKFKVIENKIIVEVTDGKKFTGFSVDEEFIKEETFLESLKLAKIKLNENNEKNICS